MPIVVRTMSDQTETEQDNTGRTIVVAVDLEGHLSPALELALSLAAVGKSAVHGLFIEDEDLLQVARLPFAAEVPRLGGPPRALHGNQLQRSLATSARQFREMLARQAEQRALEWSYSSIRGRRRDMEVGERAHADYFVMSQPRGRRLRRGPALRIMLVRDHNPGCLQALAVLLDQNPGRPVEICTMAEPGENNPLDSPELTALLQRFPGTTIRLLPPSELAGVLSEGPAFHCIVTSRSLESQILRDVLRLATCPVIMAS